MEKVQMYVGGKLALVPSDKVKLIVKKEKFVEMSLKAAKVGDIETQRTLAGKIIRLNRSIGSCVQFI